MCKVKMMDGTEFALASSECMDILVDRLNDSYQDSMEWISFVKDDGKKVVARIMQIAWIMEVNEA